MTAGRSSKGGFGHSLRATSGPVIRRQPGRAFELEGRHVRVNASSAATSSKARLRDSRIAPARIGDRTQIISDRPGARSMERDRGHTWALLGAELIPVGDPRLRRSSKPATERRASASSPQAFEQWASVQAHKPSEETGIHVRLRRRCLCPSEVVRLWVCLQVIAVDGDMEAGGGPRRPGDAL
jgi:hypothetical protein